MSNMKATALYSILNMNFHSVSFFSVLFMGWHMMLLVSALSSAYFSFFLHLV